MAKYDCSRRIYCLISYKNYSELSRNLPFEVCHSGEGGNDRIRLMDFSATLLTLICSLKTSQMLVTALHDVIQSFFSGLFTVPHLFQFLVFHSADLHVVT